MSDKHIVKYKDYEYSVVGDFDPGDKVAAPAFYIRQVFLLDGVEVTEELKKEDFLAIENSILKKLENF